MPFTKNGFKWQNKTIKKNMKKQLFHIFLLSFKSLNKLYI